MVIVPKEVFERLNRGVSEDNIDKKSFSFDDFIREVKVESEINPFLVTKNIEYVGTGSSRTAYMIPKGSCEDAKRRSVCFKIAKNLAGIAQNRAEHKIFKKYGDNECFPEIFKYDSARNLCLETEIGTSPMNYNIERYFADWNEWLKEANEERSFVDKFKSLIDKNFRFYRDIYKMVACRSIQDMFCVLYTVKDFKKMGQKDKNLASHAERYLEAIDELGRRFPKYRGISSLFEVFFKKGAEAELIIGDFNKPENYAFVDRGADGLTLIPIDYGFTEKVYTDFYRDGRKSEFFKDLA